MFQAKREGRVAAECLCLTDHTGRILPLSSQRVGTFNEVIYERGLARGEGPIPFCPTVNHMLFPHGILREIRF